MSADAKKKEGGASGQESDVDVEQLREELERMKLDKKQRQTKLIDKGFPPLGAHVCSSTTAAENKSHAKAKLVQAVFNPFKDSGLVDPPPLGSDLWNTLENSNAAAQRLNDWSSESCIHGYVRSALFDVIKHSGLQKHVNVLNEVSIFHSVKKQQHRADIWVVRNQNGFPIGVCEVKKPNKKGQTSALQNEYLNGQIYDYMVNLRQFFGLRRVFGIISTYAEWRICWLPDNDVAAAETSVETYKKLDSSAASSQLDQGRTIHASRIYSHNEPTLIQALVHLVHKMYHSPYDASPKLIKTGRRYPLFSTDTWDWTPLDENFKLSYCMPPAHTSKFYLLQQYHGGADGLVWLAASAAGNLVVLKFGFGQDREQVKKSLNAEAERWQRLWGANARTIKLFRRWVLVMPFAFHGHLSSPVQAGAQGSAQGAAAVPIVTFKGPNSWTTILSDADIAARAVAAPGADSDAVREDDVVMPLLRAEMKAPEAVAEAAVKTMLKEGLMHADLCWRHVALLPYQVRVQSTKAANKSSKSAKKVAKSTFEWRLKPILIDLTRVQHVISPSDDTAERKSERDQGSHDEVGDDDDEIEDDDAEEAIEANKDDLLAEAIKKLQDEKDSKAASQV